MSRLIFAFVLFFAALAPARADNAAPLTQAQVEAVQKIIQSYLMDNPRILSAAIQKAKDTAEADAAAETKKKIIAARPELEQGPASTLLGNPDGDITLVEFFDFRCPYCKATAGVLAALLADDKHVRVVTREFPVLGPDSTFMARVALVAKNHGKYPEFYKTMFAQQDRPSTEKTLEIAKSLGLNPDLIKKEMDDPAITAVINQNLQLGKDLSIDGTPTFFAATSSNAGALDLAGLKDFIAKARADKS